MPSPPSSKRSRMWSLTSVMTIEPEAHALPFRGGRDGLDIAGPQRAAGDVDLALDDRRVGDDLAVQLEHEMDATDRVLPVVVGEPLLLVRVRRRRPSAPDRPDLGRVSSRGRELAQTQAIGIDVEVAFHRPSLVVASSERPQPPISASVSGLPSTGASTSVSSTGPRRPVVRPP